MQPEDIAALVEQYGTAVYRLCHKLTGNKPDADDLYQEAYLTAFEKCRKIDAAGNPRAFLCTVAVRLWKNNRRKYFRRQRLAPSAELVETDDIADSGSVEEDVLRQATYAAIQAAVDGLGDKHRIPVYLFYTLEMGIEEIAGVLKIPPGTVKSRLHKARSQIKTRLEAFSDEIPR